MNNTEELRLISLNEQSNRYIKLVFEKDTEE